MATVMRPPIPTGSSFDKSSPVSSYADIVSLNNGLNLKGTSDLGPTYLHAEYDRESASSLPSSAPSSPTYTASMNSYFSTPSTNSTLDPNETFDDYDESPFPCYDNGTPLSTPSTGECLKTLNDDPDRTPPSSAPCSEDVHLSRTVNDDQAVEHEPTRHVDYLSHEWREEDIWSSWRYIVSRRKTINNSVRLENASWRTWIKTQNHLKTVSPETLNWLKDCDVTWLYGPLQVDAKKSLCKDRSPPPSHLSTSSSFAGVKKPILKKKSASAVILERSRSQHSLLQRAGEIIRVQQSSPAPRRPGLRRGGSDISLPSFHASSALNTPADQDTPTLTGTRSSFGQSDLGYESRHISFNEEVRQVQAIESDDDDEKNEAVQEDYLESDEDDDGGLMMAPARSRSNRSTPRGSFSDNVNTIVPLPSTTLKYRTDTPEPKATPVSAGFWSPHRSLNHTSSQETLRPTQTGHAFHLDDDPELTDSPWSEEPNSVTYDGYSYSYESPNEPGPNMRRTESGMFMPYDENEEEAVMNDTLFGQAMYAFNTVKDIAHVFRNVVWTRNR